MKSSEFVKYLKEAYNRKNYYNNTYPYNLGYYDGKNISWDCWNLGKTIIWSNGNIVKNFTKGHYQKRNPATGLGDWDGLTICKKGKISKDFSHILPGEWLYCEGHIGYYIGGGKVIEDTIAWNSGKIAISEVGKNGERTLNGKPAMTDRWILHSQIPWIDYTDAKEDDIMTQLKTLKKGSKGNQVKNLQALLNVWLTKEPPLVIDGDFGSNTEKRLKEYQKIQKLKVDGVCGENTWKDLLIN